MDSTYIVPILTALGGLGIRDIITWIFGKRQENSRGTDNESHQREKEYLEMVDAQVEKETGKTINWITKCASTCIHSLNCPVINIWKNETSDKK